MYKRQPFGSQFKTSFENLYTVTRRSKLDPARLAFLPLVVAADDGVKLCFTEADLQAYPGMYFNYPGQGSVSYTHLDVYKRQGFYIFESNATKCRQTHITRSLFGVHCVSEKNGTPNKD